MNVLYISYDGMTDPLGQSQVIPYLAGLASRGYNITIVSAEKRSAFEKQSGTIEGKLKASGIKWQPVFFSNRIPGVSAIGNYYRLQRKTNEVCRSTETALIHCRSHIPSIIGLQVKKKFGARLIFDMRGFWADERVDGGLWNLRNPLFKVAYNFFKRKEKQLLVQSDAVVSLTENGKLEILHKIVPQLPAEKITVIPCCADLDFFSRKLVDEVVVNHLKSKLKISEHDFILSYSGSVGTWYLLEEMLHFFKALLKKKPNAKFLFITLDPSKEIYSSAAQLQIPVDRILVTSASRAIMPSALSLSAASVFFIKNTFSKRASSPTKMGELMALGIPLICNDGVGDVKEIIRESGAGICLHQMNEEEFEQAANDIDQLLEIPREKIVAGAQRFFSLEEGIARYQKIYERLIIKN